METYHHSADVKKGCRLQDSGAHVGEGQADPTYLLFLGAVTGVKDAGSSRRGKDLIIFTCDLFDMFFVFIDEYEFFSAFMTC